MNMFVYLCSPQKLRTICVCVCTAHPVGCVSCFLCLPLHSSKLRARLLRDPPNPPPPLPPPLPPPTRLPVSTDDIWADHHPTSRMSTRSWSRGPTAHEEVFRPPKRGQPGHRTVRIIGVPGSRTWGVGGRRISAPPYHPYLWVIWVMNLNPSSHPGTAEPPPPLLPLVSFPPPTQQITLLPYMVQHIHSALLASLILTTDT